MSLTLIVAMDPNRVIGKDNDLPWPRIKEDMKFFKKTTVGHVVILGRKTYESIGKPLPKRTNFVISHQKDLEIEGCTVFNDFEEALREAKKLDMYENPMVIGGAAIYEMALPYVSTMYITKINKEYDGDTFFPEFDQKAWKEETLKYTEEATYTRLIRRSGL